MCGICGILRPVDGPPADAELLARMCATMRHRGPDDEGQHTQGRIALGATRLAIIDLATGRQPLSNEDGTVWAVQNGEIYNYRELAESLAARGHVLRTRSDTEVLVHLYEERGPALVDALRGMFAIAVWDDRRGRLLLARDRLGIKPLFYARTPLGFLFASEIKAILAAGIPRQLDPAALHDYLSLDFVPAPRTMYEAVRKLPAAHRLIVETEARLERYWAFPPQPIAAGLASHIRADGDLAAPGTPVGRPALTRAAENRGRGPGDGRPVDERDLVTELATRLDDAVRSHMVSDVPVGAFLSGGLDSSMIVALMSRHANHPIRTFSIGFEERSYNELPYARQVAEIYGTDHHELVIRPEPATIADGLLAAFDEPFADSSAIATYYLARMAAGDAKVVQSGDGGDEIFGGYVIYQADRLAGLYRRLPAVVGDRLLPGLVDLLPASETKMSWDLKLRRFVAHAAHDPIAAHGLWRIIHTESAKRQLYSAEYLAAHQRDLLDDEGTLAIFRRCFDAYPGSDLLNRFMVVDASVSLVDDMLTKVDRTSMAHSLEVRIPLLDHRLVEWMTTVPSQYKVRRLTLKYLLKRTAHDVLPASLVHRPKAGFHVPMPGWLKRELSPLVEAQLGEDAIRRQGVFDPVAVRVAIDRHMSGREDLSRNLWGLLLFSLWYDRNLDGARRASA